MAPPFEIHSCEDYGPTDNGADDTLFVVMMSDPGGEPAKFRFSVAASHGRPTTEEVVTMIRERASGFANHLSALDQFRECERPHGRDRLVVFLTPALA